MNKLKLLLPLLMAIVMMAGSPTKSWALTLDSDGYYKIGSATDLSDFRSLVNNGSTSIKGKLTTSFSVSSGAYTPIGTSGNAFTGTFDGKGFTITFSGATSSSGNFGLFGYVNGATIQNLKVAGTMSITGTTARSHIGGIVAYLKGASTIKGCTFSGTLDAGKSYDCIGGIVGYAENTFSGSITNCFCNGTLKTTATVNDNLYIGGILGYFNDENTKKPTIQYNFVDAQFKNGSSNMTSGKFTNAVVGRIRAHADNVTSNTCIANGNISRAMQSSNTDATIDTNTNKAITISVASNNTTYGTVSKSYVAPTSSAHTKLQVEATAVASKAHYTKWSDSGKQTHQVELTASVSLTATFTAHTYNTKTTTSDYKKDDATCTAAATYYYKCSGCAAKGTTYYSSTDDKDKCKGHGNTNGYTASYGWTGTYDAPVCTFTLYCKDCKTNATVVELPNNPFGSNIGYYEKGTTSVDCQFKGHQLYYGHGYYSDNIGSKVFTDNDKNTNNTHDYSIPATGHGNTKGFTASYTWSGTYDAPVCKFTLKCVDCSRTVVDAISLTTTEGDNGSYSKDTQTDPKCTVLGVLPCTANGKYTDATSKKSYAESGSGVNRTHSYDIPMLNHDWNDVVEHLDPTCTTAGNEQYYTCKRDCCEGKNYKDNGEHTTDVWDNIVISALNHNFNDYVCSRCDAASGEGTKASPYLIKTKEQLSWFRDGINNSSLPTSSDAKLLSDITLLSNSRWTPIALTDTYTYTGTFDGDGHRIDGLFINHSKNEDSTPGGGLFNHLGAATIKNLTVNGLVSSYGAVGLIAGYSTSSTHFVNCCTEGKVAQTNADADLGGISGSGGCFDHCVNYAEVNGRNNVGGLAGANASSIAYCINHGVISGVENEDSYDGEEGYGNVTFEYYGKVGGLVGNNTDTPLAIANSYNVGYTIKGSDNGGLVGYVKNTIPTITGKVAYIEETNGWSDYAYEISAYGNMSDSSDNIQRFSASDFASGKVAYYLNAGITSDVAWHQTLGTDDYPVLDQTHGTVYYGYVNCTEHGYSNVAVNETRGKHPSTAFDDATDPDHTLCNLCKHSILRYTARNNATISPNQSEFLTDASGNKLSIFSNTYDNETNQGEMEFDGILDVLGLNAFYFNYSLTSVIIPKGVTNIGNSAFSDCSSLNSVTIPNSVTNIGNSAFSYCSSLNSLTIPNSVTNIGKSAFQSCSSLSNLSIPESVSMGEYAFSNCMSLPADESGVIYAGTYLVGTNTKSLSLCTIKPGTKYIGDWAFYNCAQLTSITIPESVERIEGDAFTKCYGLESVTIPKSVANIRNNPFQECSSLASITVAPENTVYDSRNSNAIFETATNTLVTGCKNTTIPTGVTAIGHYAFWGCTGLTGITIPESVTSIGINVFSGCTSLPVDAAGVRYADTYLVKATEKEITSYTIKDGTRFIGSEAFCNCQSLTEVTIPKTVIIIENNAFQNCTALTNVTIPESVIKIKSAAFQYSSSLANVTFKSIPWVDWDSFNQISKSAACTLALTDDSYVYTGEETSYFPTLGKKPTYTRSVANQWGTLVVPFTFTLSGNEPYNFYQIDGVSGNNLVISKLTGTIPAGTPVLVYIHKASKNANTGMYDLTLFADDCGINTTIPTPEAVGGVTFKSTYASLALTNADADNYFIYNGAFYSTSQLKEGQKLAIKPFHAYLEVPTSNAAKLQIVVDETTSIDQISSLGESEGASVYNLNGQKLNAPQKGVNIINGKKVMVK